MNEKPARPHLHIVRDGEYAHPPRVDEFGEPVLHVLDAPVRTLPSRAARRCKRGAIRIVYAAVHSYRELHPIALGVQAITHKTVWWLHGGYDGMMVKSEPDPHARRAAWDKPERVADRRRRRIRLAVILGMLALVLALLPYRFGWLLAALVYLLGFILVTSVCDLIGRRILAERGEEVEGMPAPTSPDRPLADDTIPLRKHGATVLDTLELRGHQGVTLHRPFAWDAEAGAFTMQVHSHVPVTEADIEAIGTELGADDGATTMRRTGAAGYTEIRIQWRDVLAGPRCIDEPVPGSRSAFDMIDLGRSSGPLPLALGFPGEHMAVIGSTGAGKTDTFQTMAMHLAQCDDVVLWGGDITKGAALGQIEDVFERATYERDDVLAMLKDADAEMRRRSKILKAARKDPDNPRSKWGPDLGPAIVIMLDEAHEFGEDSDVVSVIESIARIGRESCVSIVLFTQRYSAKDIGTTAIKSQVNTVIMHPMKKRDIALVELHKDDIAAGWAPHTLVPSSKLGGPGDAGKAYIRSPFGHTDPDLYRVDCMPDDLRIVNRWVERLAAHRRALGLVPPRDAAELSPTPFPGAAEAEGAPVIRLLEPRGDDVESAPFVRESDTHPFAPAPADTRPMVLRWLRSAFDRVADEGDEFVTIAALLARAEVDAEDRTYPHRAFAARLAASKQPSKLLADEVRSARSGWEWPTDKKRITPGDPAVRVLFRVHLEHLEHLEQTYCELRV